MSSTPASTTEIVTAASVVESDGQDLVDDMAAAVAAVDGVAGLSSGPAGTAATYLPGRRVAGLSVGDHYIEVHIAVSWGNNVVEVAGAVRRAVSALTDRPVDVVVEEIVE